MAQALSRLGSTWSHMTSKLTFMRLHLLVGTLLPLIASGILYACKGGRDLAYIDALFMCVAALTTSGLTSMYISNLGRGQQVILYLLFTFGSIPAVGLIALLVRRQKFKVYTEHSPSHTSKDKSANPDEESSLPSQAEGRGEQEEHEGSYTWHSNEYKQGRTHHHVRPHPYSTYDLGGLPNPLSSLVHSGISRFRQRFHPDLRRESLPSSEQERYARHQGVHKKYGLSSAPHRGRGGHLHGKSMEQQAELGVLELRAMTLLCWVVGAYMLASQLVAIVIWAPYFEAGHFDTILANGFETSRTWFAFFEASSMFNNCDTSLANFQSAYLLLVPGIFLMFGGYLFFPIMIRALLWSLAHIVPGTSSFSGPIHFLLDHPRRVWYLLFPPFETLAYALVVVIFTFTDWVLLYLLNINYHAVYSQLSAGDRTVNGLVQSVAVRASGFYSFVISQLAPAEHILYIFMMLFGVYPLAMVIRATNVYEERAPGLHDRDEHSFPGGIDHLRKQTGYVGVHFRQQLAYDVWWIILCVWIICIIERPQITDPNKISYFTVLAIIFEVCSAYANVGFSLGVPYSSASFSTALRPPSKLVICVAMIRGRTRGLPIAIDRAILTPAQLSQHGDPPERESGDRGKGAEQEAVNNP